ncbi:hypothetical protein GGI35DRAFT_364515 [Trichoderma velutinum]
MTPQQRRLFLQFFDHSFANKLGILIDISEWCGRLHDKKGNILFHKLTWTSYLKSATLHDNLPKDYTRAIGIIHGSSVIDDFTDSYRRIYPAPKVTEAIIKTTSTSQQPNAISSQMKVITLVPSSHQQHNATPTQKEVNNVPVAASQKHNVASSQKGNPIDPTATSIELQCLGALLPEDFEEQALASYQKTHTPAQSKTVSPSPTVTQQQDTTPTQNKVDTLPALVIQQENNSSSETQLISVSPITAQSVRPEAWKISNVVDMLGHVKKKRLSSAPESSPKRVKTNDNEVLDRVNHQMTIAKSALEKLQSTAEQQGDKLQEVSTTAEQNKQTLSDMQSELRQFMSAVASTLRDIQERLEE